MQEDALAESNVGEVAAPDHRRDGPIRHGEIAGRFFEGCQPAGESSASGAGRFREGGAGVNGRLLFLTRREDG